MIKKYRYTQRSAKEKKLISKNPWGDADSDGVKNLFDCKPLDKRRQDVFLYHGTTRQAAEKIRKEGLKKDIGINPYVYLTPSKKTAIKYSAGGVVFKIKVRDKAIKDALGRLTNLPNEITISEDVHHKRIVEEY